MRRQANLLEIVDALRPCRRLAHLLHGRYEQAMRIAMMAITTSNSISVKPGVGRAFENRYMAYLRKRRGRIYLRKKDREYEMDSMVTGGPGLLQEQN